MAKKNRKKCRPITVAEWNDKSHAFLSKKTAVWDKELNPDFEKNDKITFVWHPNAFKN